MTGSGSDATATTCVIDGLGPVRLLRPASEEELAEMVRKAASAGEAVYPMGGGTMIGYGLAPSREGVAVDLRRLAAIIDYPARDMTVTVQAGISVTTLQKILADQNQRLAVDVPAAALATLGGAVATNVSGPRRCGFGTFRDYMLGATVVDGEGRLVRAGGRVVKNVAGYDLCKLYVGSLGTLGILTQVTLRLRPSAEACVEVVFSCPAETLGDLLDRLHASRTRPIAVDVLNPRAAAEWGRQTGLTLPDQGWTIAVGLEGNSQAVEWQMHQLVCEVGPHLDARVGAAAEELMRPLVEFPISAGASVTARASVPPSATATLLCEAEAGHGSPSLLAHAGSGIVTAHFGKEIGLERTAMAVQGLRQSAVAAGGNVVLWRCPPAWKERLGVWGDPPGDLGLMRAIKDRLDPRHVLNPGRFVGGL